MNRPTRAHDVLAPIVVVGAGAAGLMAAIHAAAGARRVILLERTDDGGRKILISGGGRCNVLPSEMSPSQFVTASSANTLRKILLSWPLSEQRSFFETTVGLALELEQETGKLFPSTHRARDVRDGLMRVASGAAVDVRFVVMVKELMPTEGKGAVSSQPAPSDARWLVRSEGAQDIHAHSVILATGGLSVPATGSDGSGLRIARKLGHTVHATYPALTPLTADPPVHAGLSGVSLPVTLSAPQERGSFVTRGGFLFTHRGYSGPSVLDISHLAVRAKTHATDGESPDVSAETRGLRTTRAAEARVRQPILVQWTDHDAAELERQLTTQTSNTAGGFVRRLLPQRLADALLAEAGVDPATALSQLRRDARHRLVTTLASYHLPWTGDEGYKKAEVTGGGVALGEVDPRTLQSRLHPGLFLCGEMLDAFGPIGGYNFAWAFATGRLAGRGAAGIG
jgi:predicted flavoprotein YhiN